jgi:hypothetical protein
MPDTWEVEFTDEFGNWWDALSDGLRDAVDRAVRLVMSRGPRLGYPHSSAIASSRHGQLRELRVQYRGRPIRILYAFDPRPVAILLAGGDKTGNDRWYETAVRVADALYDEHVATLRREGLL